MAVRKTAKKAAKKTVKKAACAKKPMCAAKTKEGKKCKRSAAGRSKFCSSHKK